MHRLALFEQLCGVANTLETLKENVKAGTMRDALEKVVERLDEIIDDLVLSQGEKV